MVTFETELNLLRFILGGGGVKSHFYVQPNFSLVDVVAGSLTEANKCVHVYHRAFIQR